MWQFGKIDDNNRIRVHLHFAVTCRSCEFDSQGSHDKCRLYSLQYLLRKRKYQNAKRDQFIDISDRLEKQIN